MNKYAVIICALFLGGCATISKSPSHSGWQDAVRQDFEQSGHITVSILGDGRYAVRGQPVTIQDMSLIKQELLLPQDTPFVLSATPKTSHADVQAMLFVIKEQYWKIKFIGTK